MKQSTILFNKYEVISKLGHGASSVIFLVRNIKLNVNRAIKRIDKSHHLYSRFVAEAQIHKSLNYPNIPIIYDIEEDDQYLYIIESQKVIKYPPHFHAHLIKYDYYFFKGYF